MRRKMGHFASRQGVRDRNIGVTPGTREGAEMRLMEARGHKEVSAVYSTMISRYIDHARKPYYEGAMDGKTGHDSLLRFK